MTALLLSPVVLSLLVLAAHFLRAGRIGFFAAAVAAALLVAIPRAWAARLLQVALALGALEWAWTLRRFVAERTAAGRPAGRLVLILGSVIAVTLFSLLAFRSDRVRRWFGTGGTRPSSV